MRTNIFVNLPVKDLGKTKSFFGSLGYKFNPQFTNHNAACMIIDKNIYIMLVAEDFYKKLTKKEVFDAHKGSESATCITVKDKKKVNVWADKALSLGATENIIPEMNQEDSMYGRSINDLDGHIWEVMWMDPKTIQKN